LGTRGLTAFYRLRDLTPRLYVFDADGTLRRTLVAGQPCPHAPEEWALMPRVREVLARIPWGPEGPWLGIASNQDHVGYGLVAEDVCRDMLEALGRAATGGRAVVHVAFCPHVLEVACGCRKPAPGLLLALMARFGVGPEQTLFVGDAESDAGAAAAAGVAFQWAEAFFG
jgi:D-glycero-D-manno-heptose 1,7-bisphosphate phosphatase